jgi:predicted aspartyl protease
MPSSIAARTAPFAILLALSGCAGDHTVCRTDLPLEERRYHLIVPASINGHTIPALMDTGAQTSSVTEDVITRLELQSDPRHGTILSGVGGQGVAQNDALISRFELAGYDAGEQHYSVLQLWHDSSGKEPVGALVGADLLSHFDIDLDIPQHKLTLYDPDKCGGTLADWGGSAVQVPLERSFGSGRLSLKIKLDGQDVVALIDTGSDGSVIDLSAAERLGVTRAMLAKEPGQKGTGAAGVNFGLVEHQFKSMDIGGEHFDAPKIAVLDRDLREVDMILGLDWIRRHRVLISFRRQMLYITRSEGGGAALAGDLLPVLLEPVGHRL